MVQQLLEKVHESANTDKERLLKMQSHVNDAGKAIIHARAVAMDMKDKEMKEHLLSEVEKVSKSIKELYQLF